MGLFVLVGVVHGQKPEREEEKLSCELEIEPHDRVPDGVLGYRLKVTLTYNWFQRKMVRGDQGLQLVVVTREGKEIETELWGADGTREPGLSDFHMLRAGGGAIFSFGMRAYERKGKWFLSWTDALGNYHGCKLKTLEGIKLVMNYANEAKEDFKLKLSETSTLEVKKEEVWSGEVRSKEVPLVIKKGHSIE